MTVEELEKQFQEAKKVPNEELEGVVRMMQWDEMFISPELNAAVKAMFL